MAPDGRQLGGNEGCKNGDSNRLDDFCSVIGSHVFLWRSCRRGGGSSRDMTVQFTGSPTSMNKPGDGIASGRENRDCYQYSDDETIFLAHRVCYRLATCRVDATKDRYGRQTGQVVPL